VADEQRDKPGLANFSGILTVLLMVAGAVWLPAALDTYRPAPSTAGVRIAGVQDVEARLWQDPFGVAGKAYEERRSKPPRDPADAVPGPEVLRKQVADNVKRREGVTAIGVMVLGGRFVGAEEYRRRTRYAVLSALMGESYRPFDAERIGYVETAGLKRGFPAIVPYEWLDSDARRPVLLLWLDESALSQEPAAEAGAATPAVLSRIARLLGESIGQSSMDNVRLDIIGPATSDTLLAMAEELGRYSREEYPAGWLDKMGFYSPFATIANKDVRDRFWAAGGKRRPCGDEFGPCPYAAELFNGDRGLRTFVRAQAPDDAVVGELRKELRGRGVDAESPIAIVGEIDSEYARRLAGEIERAHLTKASPPRTVQRFNYMRGLDGRLPDGDADDGEAKKQGEKARESGQVERPEGDQQFDYVRRLRDLMKQQENRLTEAKRGPGLSWGSRKKISFAAIGVIGNDYYDKLLLLQALRPAFPEAIFFTTDLYASMLHPTDNKATRNLVVASGVGLSFNPSYQKGTPPFRDSYQSATYLAVSLALASSRGAVLPPAHGQPWLQPVAWEVGRTRFFPLSPEPQAMACSPDRFDCPHDLHYARAGLQIGGVLLVGFAALLAGLVISARMRATGVAVLRSRWLWLAAAPLAVLAGYFAILPAFDDAMSWSGEPFAWFEGVSVWPSNLMRAAALVVAVLGLVYGWRCIAGRIEETSAKFFPRDFSCDEPPAGHENPSRAWNAYRHSMRLGRLAGGGFVQFLCVFLLCMLIFWVAGSEIVTPGRSEPSRDINRGLVIVAVIFTWYLLACIAVAVVRTNCLTRGLARKTAWPDAMRRQHGLPDSSQAMQFDDWLDLQVIARQTEAVSRLVYFPFLALLLLVLARSPFFDNWSTPVELAVVLSLSFVYLIVAAAQLRATAERARTNALRALERKLIILQGSTATGSAALAAQCRTLVEQIQKLSRGAFLPFSQQSLVRAFLALLGGISGAKLLEYAALANF
jgi:hypothetical protein